MPHIAVLGAGIAGVTTAFKLIKRGFQVTIIDRQAYAAMETSYANGGQLSASNAEVWNSIATMKKGMKWLFKKDAPLSMNLSPSWHKYSWLVEFIAAIPHHDRNTIETTKLAILARKHLLDMAEEVGIDFNVEHRGIMHIYKNAKELESGRRGSKLLAQGGLERVEMSPDELRKLEPTLPEGVIGGFFTKSDFTGDIHKYTNGLAAEIRRRGGKLQMGTRIRRVKANDTDVRIDVDYDGVRDTLRFDGAVVCAGVGSRDLAAQFGDRVNIYPVKGYSITVQMADEISQNATPWVSLLDDEAKIVTSRLGKSRFRIAGTAEFNGYNYDIVENRVAPLSKWCHTNFPDIDARDIIKWAGLRPMMPNMMPKVGQGHSPRVFYNTGHGHLGWTLSAATADITAAQIDANFAGTQRKFFNIAPVAAE